MTKKLPQIWYEEGLKFKCTGCGKCCTGSNGYAWLTEADVLGLARHLNLSVNKFLQKFTRYVNGSYALLDAPGTDRCIFLEGKQCRVYEARPSQCKQFPFWPGVVASKEEWESLKSECEGIDHPEGKHFSKEEIEELSNPFDYS